MRNVSLKRRVLNLSLFTVFLGLLISIGVLLWLCHLQADAFAYPPRSLPALTPSDKGIAQWEEVSFITSDGLNLFGWYVPPQPESGGAALIYVHGWGGNRGDYLNEVGLLATYGYGALLFDLRNHGSSDGEVTTMGLLEVKDVEAAFAFLAVQEAVNPQRIGIYGGSMGGATAVRAMAAIPQARLLVLNTAYVSFVSVVADGIRDQTVFPGFPFAQIIVWMTGQSSGTDLFDVRPIDDIARIAPRPVFIMHGTADPTIPVEHAQRLFEAAQEPKELYLVSGGVHGGSMELDIEQYQQRLLPFLQKYFR